MNKLKTKLDGALNTVRVTDRLKGEIISMTENKSGKRSRRSPRFALIVAVACLLLALVGGAIAATWHYEEAPDVRGALDEPPNKGYEYDRTAPDVYNEENVEAILTESDDDRGVYGDFYADTLAEVSDYLGVTLVESDVLTPCDEDCVPTRKSGIVIDKYNLHAYKTFTGAGETFINIWKDYHTSNGDLAECRWTFTVDDRKLSGGMIVAYPSDAGLEVKTVSLTSENGLTANLLFAKDTEGNYWDTMDHEARLAISGYDYHLTIAFPDYTCTDDEIADLAQSILDSLPAAD